MKKNNRRNFILRLQPGDGTLLAEVTDWLQSIPVEERREKVEEAFIIMMLPYVKKAKIEHEFDEVESSYWNTYNRLMHYLYIMQEKLGIKATQPIPSLLSISAEKTAQSMSDEVDIEDEDEEEFDNFTTVNSLLGIG